MTQRTIKVLYDVEDAIKSLNKLNAKVDKTGKGTEQSFAGGTKAGKLFDRAMGKLPPTLQKVAGSLKSIVSPMGLMTGLAAGAAAAVGGLAAQFIDLPGLLRDSAAGMDAFNNATQGVLDAENTVSSISDALINAENKRRSRGLRQKQAELDLLQVEVREKQDAIRDELSAAKSALNERDKAVQNSVNKRIALEEKLQQRQGTTFAPGSGAQDADIRASILQDRALEQAQKGNIDAAEELVRQAEALIPELDNAAFFYGQNEDVNAAINSEIEKQIQAAKQAEAAAASLLDVDRERVAALEEQFKLLDKQNKAVTNAKTAVGAEVKQAREAQRVSLNKQERDEAARTLNAAGRRINRELVDGGRSVRENILDSFRQSADNLKQAGITEEAQNVVGEGLEALVAASRVTQDPDATFGDFARVAEEFLPQISRAVGVLETVQARGDIGGGFDRDILQLQRVEESLQQIGRATARAFAADATRDTAAVEGTDSPFDRFGQRVEEAGEQTAGSLDILTDASASAAEKLRAISAINVGGTAPAVPTPAASVVQPTTPAENTAPTNINVTARVEGGIIDEAVVTQITDIVNREIRKSTANRFGSQ